MVEDCSSHKARNCNKIQQNMESKRETLRSVGTGTWVEKLDCEIQGDLGRNGIFENLGEVDGLEKSSPGRRKSAV